MMKQKKDEENNNELEYQEGEKKEYMLVDLWETECMQADDEEEVKVAVVHHDDEQEKYYYEEKWEDNFDDDQEKSMEAEEELQKKDYCKTQKMKKEENALEADSYSDCRYYNKGGGSKVCLAN